MSIFTTNIGVVVIQISNPTPIHMKKRGQTLFYSHISEKTPSRKLSHLCVSGAVANLRK